MRRHPDPDRPAAASAPDPRADARTHPLAGRVPSTMRCPACWASLRVADPRLAMMCPWCGTESSLQFGRLSAGEPICNPPRRRGDPNLNPADWTTEECLYGLLHDEDDQRRRILAELLSAQLTTEATASHAGTVVLAMYDATPELDLKLGQILERIAWFGGLDGRQQVLLTCRQHVFLLPESAGILRALSSLRIASLRMLVDVAIHAEQHGMRQRAIEALSELRLVLDFERGDDLLMGLDILFAIIPKVDDFIQTWLLEELAQRILAMHTTPESLEPGTTHQRRIFAHLQWLTYLNPALSDALIGRMLEARKDKTKRVATRRFLRGLHQHAPDIANRYQPVRRLPFPGKHTKPIVLLLAAFVMMISAIFAVTHGLQGDTLLHHGSGRLPSPPLHSATISLVSLFSRPESASHGACGRTQLPPAGHRGAAGALGDPGAMANERSVPPRM